ncbi:hypothetical protein PGTUg99_029452 [Puccinia graminis f. sp. tritici]|uniref:Uncharacterized protein n=1 Tax=Puccinia graminis f. sp. tritici TaxID=56615 RepID=A0A5B0S0N0_PUCGR|nr:hypothetical protein PGTUg99_029452 [Puccinia graminis f. sp. tritici]
MNLKVAWNLRRERVSIHWTTLILPSPLRAGDDIQTCEILACRCHLGTQVDLKTKSLLAGAFEKTSEFKFDRMNEQVAKQLAWEKEKFNLQNKKEIEREERMAKREDERWERQAQREDARYENELRKAGVLFMWEKEKYQHERNDKLQRMKLAERMMNEGKGTDEIERILRLL